MLHAQLAREPRGPAARKAHLERVATLEAMGDAGAALAELRQAVRFEPGHKEAWLLLADRCTEREQFGEAAWALENAATATEGDEERQHTWERLALFCREVLHNTEKARLYARRAESLRKSREQRARPPPPEPARTAPPQTVGVPPPSVLVAPPSVLVPSKRKGLSDEVTSNTDVPSLLKAEEDSPDDAPAKRSSRTKEVAARKAKASPAGAQSKAPSGRPAAADAPASGTEAPRQPKAPSGRHAPVGTTASNTDAAHPPKAPSGRHAPV
ncbi:tetratricopeptide repeat protein, partial [Corallococcus sp. 4LFB]|uniref:tetratricopeptide repeat protein n=1 Tax=Corallococcus sp. 4LFB TaxID=3383249 RepID=UPI0039758001